jgi:hypothetical protein
MGTFAKPTAQASAPLGPDNDLKAAPISELETSLDTLTDGLTPDGAEARRARYGLDAITDRQPTMPISTQRCYLPGQCE